MMVEVATEEREKREWRARERERERSDSSDEPSSLVKYLHIPEMRKWLSLPLNNMPHM